MPYGDYGDATTVSTPTSWVRAEPRRAIGLVSLALATLLSFGAGVGSTLVYLQTFKGETSLAALPLIEADKNPTRVRPEGFDAVAPRVAQLSPSGLPSPISSAMAAVADPAIDLTPQGIPTAPELLPPVSAVVIELGPPATTVAPIAAPAVVERMESPLVPQFQLQLASMRTPEGANEELNRLKRLHANLLGSIDLTVQRIDQGARGVFFRVLSGSVGERPEAAQLCSAIAEKRGQCAVVALRPTTPVAAPEIRSAEIAKPADMPLQQLAVAPVEKVIPPAPAAVAVPAPAAPAVAAVTRAEGVGSEVRAQLGSLRSMDGATREVARLNRLYGQALGPTELMVSRIDQGERGVFYRILTAPLPSRDAGADLCQRLGASQAGCVLIPGRPTA